VSTVAIICAMPMELRAVVKQLKLRKEDVGGVAARVGAIGDHRVVAVYTGMGTELATRSTERLLDAMTPDRVVVVGITGAMEDDTPIGTMILPEVVVNSETGSEHRPAPLGGGTPRGTMWTTNVITPPAEVAELRAKGVVSLDMETAAIAESCEQRGIPWSVFRAISDRASDGSIDDELFHLSNQDGTPNPRAVARYFLRHPLRIPRLMSMGMDAKRATEVAAAAAIAAIRTVD